MPRDLFEEAGIAPKQQGPRDLFAENNVFTPKDIPGQGNYAPPIQKQQPEMVNTILGQMAKPSGTMQPSEEDIKSLILSSIPGGRMVGSALKSAQNAPMIGNTLKLLAHHLENASPVTKGLAKYGETGTEGALIGAAMNPEDRAKGAMQGAALGAGGRALVEGGANTVNALRPSNFLRGNLPADELAKNVEATSGTKTSLGDIIQNPLMKSFYENYLTKLPLSGGHKALAETGASIINKGQNIVDNFLPKGIHPEEVTDRLGQALIQAKKQSEQEKSVLYDDVDKLAKNTGLTLTLPKFSDAVKKHIDSIENTTMLQHEPEVKAILNRLRNYQNPVKETTVVGQIVDKSGKPLINETTTQSPSIKEANILAGKLIDLAEQNKASLNATDRGSAKVLGELGKSLKNDIKSSINKNGSKELKNEFERAESNYQHNYSKFLDKDLFKFTEKGNPPEDILSTFLKTAKTSDKAAQLSKLMGRLSQSDQDLVKYGYFSRAMEGPEEKRIINANKLASLWKNLGMKQKKVLVPEKSQRKEFDNFSNLSGKNQEALNLMYNPKTGQRGLVKFLWQAPMGLAMRPVVNKLTSEDYRNKLVNKMIENTRQGSNNGT